jgi:hypothetical protein
LDGSSADTGSVGIGNIPLALALLPKQLRSFAIVQLRTVYKILNDAKSEYGHIFFLLFFHKSPLVLGLQLNPVLGSTPKCDLPLHIFTENIFQKESSVGWVSGRFYGRLN